MKKSTLSLLIIFAFLLAPALRFAYASDRGDLPVKSIIAQDDLKKKKEVTPTTVKVVYTCPMHQEVISDKPGKCPKCGMNLVKKETAKVVYTCPMHPEVISDKAGKCPKCGMNLAIKESDKKQKSQEPMKGK